MKLTSVIMKFKVTTRLPEDTMFVVSSLATINGNSCCKSRKFGGNLVQKNNAIDA